MTNLHHDIATAGPPIIVVINCAAAASLPGFPFANVLPLPAICCPWSCRPLDSLKLKGQRSLVLSCDDLLMIDDGYWCCGDFDSGWWSVMMIDDGDWCFGDWCCCDFDDGSPVNHLWCFSIYGDVVVILMMVILIVVGDWWWLMIVNIVVDSTYYYTNLTPWYTLLVRVNHG